MKIEIDKPVVPQWFDDWYKTFYLDKNQALYHLSRTGWGYPLTDGEDIEVEGGFGKLRDLSDSDGYNDCYSYEDAQEYLSKAILLGYEVKKEPLYYAKIKGWEVLGERSHWIYLKNLKKFIIGVSSVSSMEIDVMTKEEWNELGINDTNADFEEVEVWEIDLTENS